MRVRVHRNPSLQQWAIQPTYGEHKNKTVALGNTFQMINVTYTRTAGDVGVEGEIVRIAINKGKKDIGIVLPLDVEYECKEALDIPSDIYRITGDPKQRNNWRRMVGDRDYHSLFIDYESEKALPASQVVAIWLTDSGILYQKGVKK